MNPERAHNVQREIKDSAEDLKEYVSELKRWEADIKRKDLELLRQKQGIQNVESQNSLSTADSIPTALNKERETVDDIPVLESREEIEKQIRMQKAELEKERGNVFLKKNDLDRAVECYTSGLTLDPNNALIHANRALALLKKQHYAAAETDCDEALRLNPKYVKAYLRRAASRSALGKLSRAKDDLLEALTLEPNNPQAKQELVKVEKSLTNEKIEFGNTGTMVQVTPIEKPPHLRSKVPLRRIRVVPLSEDDLEIRPEKDTKSESKDRRWRPPIVEPVKPKVPKLNISDLTSYQFQKEFRRLKSHPEVFYGYIKQIPVDKYPQLFQHSLESEVLSHLLRSYRDFYLPNGDDVYEHLSHLSKTKRFATIRMFFSSEDKQVLCDLFVKLQETNSNENLESLRSVYGMS